jgi:hypothetical protein
MFWTNQQQLQNTGMSERRVVILTPHSPELDITCCSRPTRIRRAKAPKEKEKHRSCNHRQ